MRKLRLTKNAGWLVRGCLALGLLGLGSYWLYYDAGVGDLGLIEGQGGVSGVEDVTTQEVVVGTWDASGEGARPVSADSLRTLMPKSDTGGESGTVLEIPVFLGPGRPLTQGSIWVMCKTRWTQDQIAPAQSIPLYGQNLLRIHLPVLPDPRPEIVVSVAFSRQPEGSTAESWSGQQLLSWAGDEQQWVVRDLVLKKRPQILLCKGIVVDQRGSPVADAKLRVRLQASPQGLSGLGLGLTVDTGENGTFVFYYAREPKMAALAQETLELKASAPGHFGAKTGPFRVGTVGMRVVLEKSASIQGSVILPSGVDASWLGIDLRNETRGGREGKERRYSILRPGPRRDGEPSPFRLDMLHAGSYVLSLCYLTSAYPLIRIGGIKIRSGQDYRDARVQKLDLRGLLKFILFSLHTDEGGVPLNASVQIHSGRKRSTRALRSEKVHRSGNIKLTIPRSGVDLVVKVPNYADLRIRRVRADRTIVLKTATALPRAEIQVKGGMPKNGIGRFWLELESTTWISPVKPGDKRERGQRFPAKEFSLSGRYYFTRLKPGPYRVHMLLKSKGRVLQRLPVEGDPVFTIRRTSRRQVFSVLIDRQRIGKLLVEIKEQEHASPGRR